MSIEKADPMAGNVNISSNGYINSRNGATILRLKISVTKQDCPSPHSLANKIGRLFWEFVWLVLFRPSPKIFLAWRRLLLRSFGAKIGKNVKVMPSAKIWAPWNLTMAEEACLSH